MAKKWLTREDSIQYLNEAFYGHLATMSNNQPYLVPVNYVYHQNHLYIHSALQGQKLENIRKNSRVCFEVSHPIQFLPGKKPCQFGVYYWSVLVFGQANILDDLNLKNVALNLFIKKYSRDDYLNPMDPDDLQNVAIIDIHIETISGKANN
jgi:nitroimidazol reductase NimA-like FMN-containing flavoprotein (pyridoxamine 5'-phosphate oxidase superfamily)